MSNVAAIIAGVGVLLWANTFFGLVTVLIMNILALLLFFLPENKSLFWCSFLASLASIALTFWAVWMLFSWLSPSYRDIAFFLAIPSLLIAFRNDASTYRTLKYTEALSNAYPNLNDSKAQIFSETTGFEPKIERSKGLFYGESVGLAACLLFQVARLFLPSFFT